MSKRNKMTVKYLVVGANGQLGQEIVRILQERNENFVAFNSKELDITNRKLVFSVISDENPDVILDAAAYTKVDFAEEDGKYLNWLVNAEGTKNLADAAETVGATIVYVSTDYVFEGLKLTGYLETDAVKPKTEYGRLVNLEITLFIQCLSWATNWMKLMWLMIKKADQLGQRRWLISCFT